MKIMKEMKGLWAAQAWQVWFWLALPFPSFPLLHYKPFDYIPNASPQGVPTS